MFRIEGVVDGFEVARGGDCNADLYYVLGPYFGGDEEAPHDISIYMREIY